MRRWGWALSMLLGCKGATVEAPTTDAALEVTVDASASEVSPDSSLEDAADATASDASDTATTDTAATDTAATDSATTDTAATDTAAFDTATIDTATVETSDAATMEPPSDVECGTHKAGPMVWSGMTANFCIDAREVSRAEYKAFQADSSKPASPVFCDWNTSFAPTFSVMPDDYPITGVDFCDAWTFCEWAGKHLCGALADGKPTESEATGSAQWAYACAAGDAVTTGLYATGAAPATGQCELGSGTVSSVLSHATCVGPTSPWSRVRNLSGNVREWDAGGCFMPGLKAGTTATERAGIDCAVRGGSYAQSFDSGRCVTSVSMRIDGTNEYTGFRCCKGPF